MKKLVFTYVQKKREFKQYYNGATATVIHSFTSFSLFFWEIKGHVLVLDAYVWFTNDFQACRWIFF